MIGKIQDEEANMKRRCSNILPMAMIAALIFLFPFGASAESLVWNASTGAVDGYIVYWGNNPNAPDNSHDVGNTLRFQLDSLGMAEGVTYYLQVTAYNAAGESQPCSPVVYTPGDNTPPLPPIGLSTQ
jgi:hypothetical protein